MITRMVYKHGKQISLFVYPRASRMQLQLRHIVNVSPHEIFLELKFSSYYFQLIITNFM